MKSTCCSCHILIKLEFSRQIFKDIQTRNFIKIHPVGVSFSMRTGRQNDRQRDL